MLLVAADDPGRFVRVDSGRLPGACSATRCCELIAVRGRVAARTRSAGPFTVVGSGRLAG